MEDMLYLLEVLELNMEDHAFSVRFPYYYYYKKK